MQNPINNIDDSLIAKYLEGSTSDQESAVVESWIAKSSENKQVFNQYKTIWLRSQAMTFDPEISFDVKTAFKHVLNKIEHDPENEKTLQKSKKSLSLPAFFVRAAAVLLIGIVTYFVYQNISSSGTDVLFADTDDSSEFVMADSSIINLNAGGEIKYAKNFLGDRKLSLSGEAFFEVKKQNDQAFIVQAFDLDVKVLGTSFYIIALENDSLIEVGVKTGSVQVAQNSGQKSVVLKENEVVKYNKNTHSFSTTESFDKNALFWLTGLLEFNEQPLDQVLYTLQKVYDTEFVFRKSALENCSFTGRFQSASLEEILEQLQFSFNIEITINENVVITGNACEE